MKALSRGPLAKYTIEELQNMRSRGMSNAEIAIVLGSKPNMVWKAIGPQPKNKERQQLYQNTAKKSAETQQMVIPSYQLPSEKDYTKSASISNPSSAQPISAEPMSKPVISKLDSIRLTDNGTEFVIFMKDKKIRICQDYYDAPNAMDLKLEDVNNFIESLINVSDVIAKLKNLL